MPLDSVVLHIRRTQILPGAERIPSCLGLLLWTPGTLSLDGRIILSLLMVLPMLQLSWVAENLSLERMQQVP